MGTYRINEEYLKHLPTDIQTWNGNPFIEPIGETKVLERLRGYTMETILPAIHEAIVFCSEKRSYAITRELLRHTEHHRYEVSSAAGDALIKIGKNALPELIEWLCDVRLPDPTPRGAQIG